MFLTALASGCRRSEIHVLSFSDVQFTDLSVDLLKFPGFFLAKNQLPSALGDLISFPSLSGEDVSFSKRPGNVNKSTAWSVN